jgi:hypothetical protein
MGEMRAAEPEGGDHGDSGRRIIKFVRNTISGCGSR